MCVSPISIPNPNYGYTGAGCEFKDTDSAYIAVPCGYCSECIALKQIGMIERCQMESTKNRFYFCTLTYRNEVLPETVTSSGYTLNYPDFLHIELMLKRLSKYYPSLRALFVSEYGGLRSRPHFHGLLAFPKSELKDFNACLSFERELHDRVFNCWSVNVGSDRHPVYFHNCEYHEKWVNRKLYKNYDCHFVNPSLTESGFSDVAWYVLKYMLKRSDKLERLQSALRLNLAEDEYRYIWNLVRPKMWLSHNFGLNPEYVGRVAVPDWDIIEYLRSGIQKTPSDSPYPFYFVPDTGVSLPLTRFYNSKGWIFPAESAKRFLQNRDIYYESKSSQESIQAINKFSRILNIVEDSGSDNYLNF